MRYLLLLLFTALPGSLFVSAQTPKHRVPVLVELFTSEGCSSCPPADALLSRLSHEQPVDGAQIIVLGEHVDYWDGLGWRDRFSSQLLTARQNQYGQRFRLESVYTPQMVVDGSTQFVGNDQTQAWRAVAGAAQTEKLQLALSPPRIDGHRFSASVSSSGNAPQGDLYAALVDPMDTTDVRRGENGGQRLRHVAVVRTLLRIGGVSDLSHGPLSFTLVAPDPANVSTMQVVVFAQQQGQGRVFAAVSGSGNILAAPQIAQSSGR